MPTGSLPRIIQLQDGSYATPDGKGGWAPYSGALPGGGSAAPEKEPFKVGDSEAISHAWDVVDSIKQSKDLAGKPLATGTMAASITGIPVVGGVVGQNRANLQTKLGQIAGDLRQLGIRTLYQQTGQKGVGSIARNQSEQQALQSSLAPIGFVDQGGHLAPGGAQPDAATLRQGLDNAQRIYHRHLARLYGLDPDDPATDHVLESAAEDPNIRTALLHQATAAKQGVAKDEGLTGSGALPVVNVQAPVATSGGEQATVDPALERVKPQLEAMLNADPRKVSNGDILTFLKSNGVNATGTNILQVLPLRASGKYKGFSVDPRYNKPLHGLRKAAAAVTSFAPGGVPVGATLASAGDVASLGAAPDVAGLVNAATGAGPTRSEVIEGRDVSAQEHPYGTFAGNIIGGAVNPLFRGGGIGRTALMSGAYGALGSEDPSVQDRLASGLTAATIGSATHGLVRGAGKLGTGGYRAARGVVGGEDAADANALAHAADAMPTQDVPQAQADLEALRSAGAAPPAAAGLNRAGQEFLSRVANSSPTARIAGDQAAAALRAGIPADLAASFDQTIAEAAPHGDAAKFLSRPTREIASDVQDMAGREYETGIDPIKHEPVAITPELVDTLTHERIGPAIKDALASHRLDENTRSVLRGLPGQLKALNVSIPGANPEAVAGIQAQYAKGIPMTVSAARNIATALDRTAIKVQGTDAAVQLRGLARDIRGTIGEQYPEFEPVNERYATRQRAIDAMEAARSNFLGETPEQIDALAKASKNFGDAPNPAEYKGVLGAEPNGAVQPSNRQFAMAGAREAATTKAGTGTGTGGSAVARQLAEGPNQQARNQMVLGSAVPGFARNVGAKAKVAEAVERVTSGPASDQTEKLWRLAKRAIATKLTGGVSHYVVGSALASIPSMTGEDAARVTRIFLDAGSADQALKALSKSYGAARARDILARVAGLATGARSIRSTPEQPKPSIGSPLTVRSM